MWLRVNQENKQVGLEIIKRHGGIVIMETYIISKVHFISCIYI